MTNARAKTSSEAEYDEILRKLDTLLLRHQGKPSVSARADANAAADFRPTSIASGSPTQVPLTAADTIPTLTEMVYLPPSMLSAPGDITSLIAQIVDSALKDTGEDLGAGARAALVQALESRLFGL
ncbi:hypothetical protein [Nitrosospira sp. Is2]|uniref:hypothetical protein n=1 Tax=Nitrosospira sp. Is2 TaxID=3080532 RepID=UPI0029529D82|nr:hypothetical protein [Nitrosospira sp. Is2]WON73037.1 hypothetical protein R5L00_11120 [Nitrosospira sp. Is2]